MKKIEDRIAVLETKMIPPVQWRTIYLISHDGADGEEQRTRRQSIMDRDRSVTGFQGNYVMITGFCGQWQDTGTENVWGLCGECRKFGRCQHDGEVAGMSN